MRKVGNNASNQIYNPQNRKPPVPVDADEADSAMERFIRQKYVNNVATSSSTGRPRGSPRSDEGTPPPLPPKNSTKFGLRSASSIFPLSSRAKKEAKQQAAAAAASNQALSPTYTTRPKGLGVAVDYESGHELDKKLGHLRDMGFNDTQRNTIVLKGVNGNLERAIESLVRLGEGDRRSPVPTATSREKTLRTSRSLTPINIEFAGTRGRVKRTTENRLG